MAVVLRVQRPGWCWISLRLEYCWCGLVLTYTVLLGHLHFDAQQSARDDFEIVTLTRDPALLFWIFVKELRLHRFPGLPPIKIGVVSSGSSDGDSMLFLDSSAEIDELFSDRSREELSRSPVGQEKRLSRSPVGQEKRLIRSPVGQEKRLSRSPVGQEKRLIRSPVGQEKRLSRSPVGQEK
ncbi:hypothetical protein WMY93_027535 [Mugilogobius chulae]|uniref:Uncharacterized protein n=1 Tax=Mugilogobius chulae TaxID=88201 RepID=A0AAW0N517_9GOBI